MWMQQGRNWNFGKTEFSVVLENAGKNKQFKTQFKSEVKFYFYDQNKAAKNNIL